ncbi:MAG: tRNA (adenosine(37)-N6)-threonylcarbamoyltransferase complex ATPase subunit type 1 TsaE [Clostridia bacterium]|nr:tRNA (adenosine(37)-N6)-threonylcarbamoyltransferase complex ATPase subunit type 1 TsaE [Clostridia bacterium]
MQKFISKSPQETEAIGKALGEKIESGCVIAYRGGLGMGKTCFTRGIAQGLGSSDTVTSPTFALINEYLSGRLPLYHFDMYRISGWEDLYSTGFFEYIDDGGVIAAEWSENIEAALPDDTIFVEINKIDDNTREIIITQKGE